MALDTNQQIFEAMQRSRAPLISLRENPSVDGISSALALSKIMRGMGKTPEIVSANYRHPGYSWLPEDLEVANSLSRIKPFVIKLDVTKTKIDELTYDLSDGKLNLYLTPKEGSWKSEDLTLAPTSYRHDLIITLECADLAALGSIFKNEPEFFTSVPVLNIDHDPANEHFGAINAVDLASASIAEIIYPLFKERNLIDEHLATLLLSGIIAKTKSFKSENVTPRALRYAAELISAGGKRENIVHELYKTRDVPTLRLWGRALARLKFDLDKKLVWTLLSKDDFMHAGATEEALPEVVHELLSLSRDIEVAAIIYEERNGGICVRITTLQKRNALSLALPWQGTGSSQNATFCLRNTDIVSAERQVIEHIKNKLNELPK